MDTIKFNRTGNFQLTNNETNELRGGDGYKICYCGCCYEDQPGGSTTEANAYANKDTTTGKTNCATVKAIVISLS
jgi:hypothetical protein